MTFAERMLRLDRRIIFLLIGLWGLCCHCFILSGSDQGVTGSPWGVRLHRRASRRRRCSCCPWISILPPNRNSTAGDRSSAPRVSKKSTGHRHDPLAAWHGHGRSGIFQVAKEMDKVNGKDYVFLGWSPGVGSLIITLGQDLYKAFPSDYYNQAHQGLGGARRRAQHCGTSIM